LYVQEALLYVTIVSFKAEYGQTAVRQLEVSEKREGRGTSWTFVQSAELTDDQPLYLSHFGHGARHMTGGQTGDDAFQDQGGKPGEEPISHIHSYIHDTGWCLESFVLDLGCISSVEQSTYRYHQYNS
jgi:hypothetical protein